MVAVGAVEVYDPSGKEGGGGERRPQKSAFESSSEEEEAEEEAEEDEEEEAIASRMWARYRSRALGVGVEEEGGWELDEEALAERDRVAVGRRGGEGGGRGGNRVAHVRFDLESGPFFADVSGGGREGGGGVEAEAKMSEEERAHLADRAALMRWQAFSDEFLLAVASGGAASQEGGGGKGGGGAPQAGGGTAEEGAGGFEGELVGKGGGGGEGGGEGEGPWEAWSNVFKYERCREVLMVLEAPCVEAAFLELPRFAAAQLFTFGPRYVREGVWSRWGVYFEIDFSKKKKLQ